MRGAVNDTANLHRTIRELSRGLLSTHTQGRYCLSYFSGHSNKSDDHKQMFLGARQMSCWLSRHDERQEGEAESVRTPDPVALHWKGVLLIHTGREGHSSAPATIRGLQDETGMETLPVKLAVPGSAALSNSPDFMDLGTSEPVEAQSHSLCSFTGNREDHTQYADPILILSCPGWPVLLAHQWHCCSWVPVGHPSEERRKQLPKWACSNLGFCRFKTQNAPGSASSTHKACSISTVPSRVDPLALTSGQPAGCVLTGDTAQDWVRHGALEPGWDGQQWDSTGERAELKLVPRGLSYFGNDKWMVIWPAGQQGACRLGPGRVITESGFGDCHFSFFP
jgi:hypothetical protein